MIVEPGRAGVHRRRNSARFVRVRADLQPTHVRQCRRTRGLRAGVQSTHRCLAFHRVDGQVALRSRRQRTLTPYFPEITAAVAAQLPTGTVLDGELVVYRDGRCDFAALQRPPPHKPASQVRHRWWCSTCSHWPARTCAACLSEAPKQLRRLLEDTGPPLLLMPATRDPVGARTWIRDHAAAGVEGVVVKHREHGYRPRRRSW